MKDYSKVVAECRKDLISRKISNASIEHAYVLFENLLTLAIDNKQPVKIVTGCLEEPFYKNIANKIKDVLDSGNRVDIIVLCSKDKIQDKSLAKMVSEHKNGSVKILSTEEAYHQQHFILVGDRSYRIEFSDEDKIAEANFNNELVGEFLQYQFDSLSQRQEIFACYQGSLAARAASVPV
jgi:hypothetical protein